MNELCPVCGNELSGVRGMQITEVQRLVVKSGERLIAKVDRTWITPEEAAVVRERLRHGLQLDKDIPIMVVTREWVLAAERRPWE